jgi:hypothetical protein
VADLIQECFDNFDTTRQNLYSPDIQSYLRIPKPLWLLIQPSDPINTIFRYAQTVYSEGVIVWGHIVQVNTLMFEEGKFDHPGEVVYSLTDNSPAVPDILESVAEDLYSLKNTEPEDAELANMAESVTNEMDRFFGREVSPRISPRIRCQLSIALFVRKHLPLRRVCGSRVPLIVLPREPFVAIPLPERYWPQELIEQWSRGI